MNKVTRKDVIKHNFDFYHGDKGGVEKLLELHARGMTQADIARYFELTPQRINVVIRDIFTNDNL